MMNIGLVHTTIRGDEKLLVNAAKNRGIKLEVVDVRSRIFNSKTWKESFDVVIERCVSTTMGMHAISFFESLDIPVVNSSKVAQLCVDKFATSLRLRKENVPTIPFAMTFTEEETATAIKHLGGYPIVIKPSTGSWGRLLAKINDRDALEAVLEQKTVLGTPPHKAFYIQKFIDKPGRDIRVTTVGGKVVCAIYRETSHWISNTARGAKAKKCKVDKDLKEICLNASRAVGRGVLGVDVFESNGGYLVNEVNHTTEFKNVQAVTGVDVAGAILDYCKVVVESNSIETKSSIVKK